MAMNAIFRVVTRIQDQDDFSGNLTDGEFLRYNSSTDKFQLQSLATKADLVNGLVPSNQLPSYVDDIIEVTDYASLPGTGETGKIYVTLDNNLTYRWSGSAYIEITDTTAVWGQVSGDIANQTDLISYVSGAVGAIDLSPYLTTSTAASTYLPLAGGTLTPTSASNIALTITGATSQSAALQKWSTPAAAANDGYVIQVMPAASSQNGYNGIVRLGRNASIIFDSSQYANTPALCSSTTANGAGLWFSGDNMYYGAGAALFTFSLTGVTSSLAITTSNTLTASSVITRNGTTATQLDVNNTYTSVTSLETFRVKANSGTAYQIGSAVGSAGGSNRSLSFGHWNSAGTFTAGLTVTTAGVTNVNSLLVNTYGSLSSSELVLWTAPTAPTIRTYNTDAALTLSSNSSVVIIGTASSGADQFRVNFSAVQVFQLSAVTGSINSTPRASASGSPAIFTVTAPSHTTLTASTEATDVNFNLARTVQFSTGNITTQRAFRIQAPTYGFVGASTITTASTLSISGAPVAGTNATITNAYALNVESGASKLGATGCILDATFSAYTWNTSALVFEARQSVTPGYMVTNSYFIYNKTGDSGRGSGLWISASATDPHFGWLEDGGNMLTRTRICRDADYVVALRNGTNPFGFRVYNTFTSSTSYELINIKGKSSANFEIGPENGSAGGTLRGLTIGGYPAGTSTIVGWAQFRPNTSTGALEAFYLGPIADSTTTGGNARGANSVDLQTVRSAANQVASGDYSAVLGGRWNRASGLYSGIVCGQLNAASGASCIFGGQVNTASGSWSFVGAGESNTASGEFSGIVDGQSNTASGYWAFVGGGSSNTASSHGTWVAGGIGGVANRYGMTAHAAGIFAANGDAQKIAFVLRRKTTDGTPATLMLDGSSAMLTISSGKILVVDILISGIKSDGTAAATYKRKVAIKNVGGTTSLVGSVETIGTDYEDNYLTDVAITADNTNDALQINVTGITGETWRWVAVVEGLEIAYGT